MSDKKFLFSRPLFSTGNVVITRAARELLYSEGVDADDLLMWHTHGGWFDLCFEDQARNVRAVVRGSRVFTSFSLGSPPNVEKVFVLTEHDRSSSIILLGAEYKWAALN